MVKRGLVVGELSVDLGDRRVLHDVSLHVRPGEILVLLGPSGCGKSTLLRALAGLEAPRRGQISWDGESVTDTAVHHRRFGLMFQHHALFPHRSVASNVGFGLEMQRQPASERARRVGELLDRVGLPGFGERPVASLSGGEAQRVALARALAPEPRLLLLDEPLASLDRLLRERLITDLLRLRDEMSLSIIHVTHDREEAFALADRLALMRDGRLVATAAPEQLWARPETEWVARFLGHHNVVPRDWAHRLAGQIPGTEDHPDDRSLLLPTTAVTVTSEQDPDAAAVGSVRQVRFTSVGFECTVAVDGTELTAVSGRRPAPGDTVGLRIDGAAIVPVYPDHPR